MQCMVKGCAGAEYAGGFCSKHYNRIRTTGTLKDGPRGRAPLSERIWRYVQKRGPHECWLWEGKQKIRGYGAISRGGRNGGMILAHRAMWELVKGPIPEGGPKPHGWIILHKCDNRLCCNPRHLRLGTQKDNVKDMDRKGRRKTVSHPGSKRPKSKHTEDQIRAFLADKDGTIRERAKRHGVTIGVAKLALYGKRWTHVK